MKVVGRLYEGFISIAWFGLCAASSVVGILVQVVRMNPYAIHNQSYPNITIQSVVFCVLCSALGPELKVTQLHNGEPFISNTKLQDHPDVISMFHLLCPTCA